LIMSQMDEETALVSTFNLGQALFGINTLEVQEVVPLGRLTPVHHASEYISGIINLRGQIVTVIDLACKLGLAVAPDRQPKHILIVTWRGEHIGLLVDSVADVVPAEMDHLAPSPSNVSASQQKYFKGVCQASRHLVAVLNLDAVLDEEHDEITNTGSG
jgi:purine-binding chemotaxis protein CheW